ncbi:hypothetical protein Y1Q_0021898 [Alligator mississippiensis]|uniref:G-protein coupled receptors family 1 profile domain-containing protein n=1 Tax=Alligator mississippiensis TaxID=8496 RepID=A0A151M622_ALLMI|nr:hypothetical protein Y1Q_0021898 [Alligator mississippiensis]
MLVPVCSLHTYLHSWFDSQFTGALGVLLLLEEVDRILNLHAHLGILLQFLVRQHIIVDCSMKQKISLFIQVSMMLANINCCLDAIGYYFITKEFREKNLKNLRKTFSSAEAHSE